jgi:hypothetical protein
MILVTTKYKGKNSRQSKWSERDFQNSAYADWIKQAFSDPALLSLSAKFLNSYTITFKRVKEEK